MQDEHGKSKQTLIMIVDDDAALGEMLSIVLNGSGFETVTCQDGLRAVEMFPTLHPDLVLLDIMLPGLDGVQVAQRIRQTDNTPIIMLTAKSDTTDVVKGLEAGADDYVVKPFEVVELMARIKARLRTLGMGASSDGAAAELPGIPALWDTRDEPCAAYCQEKRYRLALDSDGIRIALRIGRA